MTPATPPHLAPIGLGVWQIDGPDAVALIRHAIDAGYRLIDTAAAYGNETEVGQALRESGEAGTQVAVTTKVWMADYDDVPAAVDVSRRRIGRDTLDTVLLHWPVPARFDRTVRAFAALAALRERGIVRQIGVSNFSAAHLDALAAQVGEPPAVDQIEIHPFHVQAAARRALAARGIAVQAYSPLGGPGADQVRPVDHPVIRDVAVEVSATPGQVVLAWHRHHGISAVPRSANPARITENLASLRVALDASQAARIDALNTGARISADPEIVDENTFA